jgi:hypothetical protein
MGKILSEEDFFQVLDAFRVHGRKLVMSKLFDGFSNPWDSILGAFFDPGIVARITRAGLSPHAYGMVGMMASRFRFELLSVVKTSNVLRRQYLYLFKRTPSMDQLMREMRAGKFNGLAQTDGFIARILHIKRTLDDVLIDAERQNFYLPYHITEAQRTLPIHPKTRVGNVGSGGMVPLMDEVQQVVGVSPTREQFHPRGIGLGKKLFSARGSPSNW